MMFLIFGFAIYLTVGLITRSVPTIVMGAIGLAFWAVILYVANLIEAHRGKV